MKRRSTPFSRKSRPGVTLIEIIVGLVILAVLISSMIVARGRFLRQWSDGQRKIQAAAAVDRMLAAWIGGEGEDSIPVPAQGALEDVEGCTWRTSLLNEPSATRLGAAVVRLEVLQDRKRLLQLDLLKQIQGRARRESEARP
jgi:prepilin-type N-terminal cleavage/methylation domain-containing protein